MAPDDPSTANDELQFDRVASSTPAPDAAAGAPVVTCAVCKTPITTDYFHINGKTTCEPMQECSGVARGGSRGLRADGQGGRAWASCRGRRRRAVLCRY